MSFKAQFGVAEETTWGQYAAPTRLYEFLPGETLKRRQTVLTSQAIRKGTSFALGRRRVLTKHDGGGDINFEVASTGFLLLFKHMLGTATETSPVTGVHDWTFAPGDLSGLSLSTQKGVETVAGTVTPFTQTGAKITDWELSVAVDEILNLKLTFDARREATSETLSATTLSEYTTLFHFGGAFLYINDALAANVTDATVNGSNSLNTERYHLGQLGMKKEPRHNDHRTLGGNFAGEFTDLAYYNLFIADTSAELDLVFLGADITTVGSTTYTETLTITLPDVRFTGDTPAIEDPEVGRQTIPFEAFADELGDAIEIVVRTTDAAL